MIIQKKGTAIKERLVKLEADFKARGVVDIKLFLNKNDNSTFDEVARDVINALQAYLDGKFTSLSSFGDNI